MDRDQLTAIGLGYLAGLGAIPATSYYEQPVADYILSQCASIGVETHVDRYGNILATRPGQDDSATGIAFVAHMDHPGYEALSTEDDGVHGRGLGGLPQQAYDSGVAVTFVTGGGDRVPGLVMGRAGAREGNNLIFTVAGDRLGELPCAVVLDLPDFDYDEQTQLIRMRAADDLAGCAGILAVLRSIVAEPSPGAVYGLFTRAEEVGLVGARLAAADGLIPAGTIVVSVETSSVLPGAEIGDGPVVRTGDRMTTFGHEAEEYLAAAVKDIGDSPVQRQLMQAGTCEGTAFARNGYPTTGLAFPLGAWHNNGPDDTIRPEFIHHDDFATGVALLAGAAALAGTNPSSAAGARIRERPEAEERRLIDSAS
ncbi:MAG: M28 family peptidase [Dehalococcoidia bacterium]|jgi:endoglucanase|nr:M28 family peptidase [Dehalococcoidia bacterium]